MLQQAPTDTAKALRWLAKDTEFIFAAETLNTAADMIKKTGPRSPASAYPFNLALDIFGDEDEAQKIYIPGIKAALDKLSERERAVLECRYADGMTLEKCGQHFNVTRERIRQIQAKALRKLRHPARSQLFMAVPVSEIKELSAKYDRLNGEYELLKKAFEVCTAQKAEPGVIVPMADLAVTLETPIEELDLSVRSYNCLRRAGKTTLRAITETTLDELHNVRNLGRKSCEEIIAKVKSYGLTLKEEGQ